MGQGHAKEGGDPGILKDPKEQGLWGSLGGGAELAAGPVLTRLAVLRPLAPAAPLGTQRPAVGTCAREGGSRERANAVG